MIVPDSLLDRQQEDRLTNVLGEIVLRRIRIDEQLALLAAAQVDTVADFSLLPEERVVFSGFSLAKRRTEWLAGRIAAKDAALVMMAATDRDLKRLAVLNDEHGRPFLNAACSGNCRLPDISISHSGTQAVAVAAWKPCGIDVQAITPQLARVRERFVSQQEEELMASIIGDPAQSLFGLGIMWAAKEALRKVFGVLPLPGFHDFSLARVKGDPRQMVELYFVTEAQGIVAPPVLAFVFDDFALACTLIS